MAAEYGNAGTTKSGRALPGRFWRTVLGSLAGVSLLAATAPLASAEEVFTSQAAASNATDSTWIPAPERRAAVCIIDTGTDITPDTTNVIARFAVDGGDGYDVSPVKHGTLMATIASAPKNDFGMVGIAPSINVVSVRASSDGKSFGGLDIQTAIQLCVTKRNAYNIKVVSLSLGTDSAAVGASTAERNEFKNTIDNARLHGLNVVAAVGNSAREAVDWPAAYGPVFAVGGASDGGERCSFASWGLETDIWAPACPLDVARPDSVGAPAWANGSSEATVLVASVLAQVRGLAPRLDVQTAELAVIEGARGSFVGRSLDVSSAFRRAGLSDALDVGGNASPVGQSADSAGAASQPKQPATATDSTGSEPRVSPLVADPSPSGALRQVGHVATPKVRFSQMCRGYLTLALSQRPKHVEARADIFVRARGSAFPSIGRRLRFRTDRLRVRVSGAVNQVSIVYRDPTKVLASSQSVVVRPVQRRGLSAKSECEKQSTNSSRW